jgi:hypothetical protein
MSLLSINRNLLAVLGAASVLFLCFQAGCKPASDGSLELLDTNLSTLKIDDLSRTMDFVNSEKRFDQDEFIDRVTSGMNRWARSDDELFANDNWTADPMLEELRTEYGDEPAVKIIDATSFDNTDAYYLQQCAWLNKIARRIAEPGNIGAFEFYRLAADQFMPGEQTTDALAEIMGKLHPDLTPAQAADLARGLRGFDWVIRNIQLEQPPSGDPEFNGGLGYKRLPWQVLIYSRGDYVERAKVFMLLAQEMGLDSVMLAVGEGDEQKLWCPALLIGDKLFLFDTRLGLPIPKDKPGTIATLADVKADPKLLDALDLTVEESLEDDNEYWVKEKDLAKIIALIYASPEQVSRRMMHVEQNLLGDNRMKLWSSPSQLAKKLPETDGMSVQAWDIGFKTSQFRRKLREYIAQSSFKNDIADKIMWHFLEESYIDSFSVYRTARSRYFGGRFETESQRLNAIESFKNLMYSDERVASLATDTFLQRSIGIRKEKGQDAASFQQTLKSVQEQMKLVRRDAGFFLAQCHFDIGNISTAGNWLNRLLIKPDAERWRPGIEYLLGRAMESTREYDRALEVYSSKDSPQKHGNLIRSRQLKELIQSLNADS